MMEADLKTVPLGGIIEVSTIDYPKNLAAVLFFSGCNLRCPYCHNRDLVMAKPRMTLGDAMTYLESMEGTLKGVVLSGGEPTLDKCLDDLVPWLRKHHFKVKLDTNGTAVELRFMSWVDLIDYYAVDLKLPADRYSILGDNVKVTNLWSNLGYLTEHRKSFEVRTTVHRSLLPFEELERMKAEWIDPLGIRDWYLQQYVPEGGFNDALKDEPTYTDDQLTRIAIKLGAGVRNVSQSLTEEADEERRKRNGIEYHCS